MTAGAVDSEVEGEAWKDRRRVAVSSGTFVHTKQKNAGSEVIVFRY